MVISSFSGIVFYIRNIILLGSTTKKTLPNMSLRPLKVLAGSWRSTSGVVSFDGSGNTSDDITSCLVEGFRDASKALGT